MTESLFFDTDCLSAFLWIHNESLLSKLYPGRLVIPKAVYTEFCRPSIPHLKARVDTMLAKNEIIIQDIIVGTEEFNTYYQLTESPAKGHNIWMAMMAKRRKLGGNSFSEYLDYKSLR